MAPRSLARWAVGAVTLAVVALLGVGLFAVLSDPLGLGATDESDFPIVLTWVRPSGWDGEVYVGLDTKDAAALTAAGEHRKWPEYGEQVRLVPGDELSTGNLVVSVQPIDRFTWAAVALSSSGRCYATLARDDPENPKNGSTYFARFPPGTPCKGTSATVDSVRSVDIPE